MSVAERAATSSSKDMGFVDNKEAGENRGGLEAKATENVVGAGEDSEDDYEAEGREEEEDPDSKLQLGPRFSLKEHLEKDKVRFFVGFNLIFANCTAFLLLSLLVM